MGLGKRLRSSVRANRFSPRPRDEHANMQYWMVELALVQDIHDEFLMSSGRNPWGGLDKERIDPAEKYI